MADSTILYFENQEGVETGFEVIGAFFFEEQDYVILFQVDNPDPSQVTVMPYHGDAEGKMVFDTMDDDARYDRACNECLRILEEEWSDVPQANGENHLVLGEDDTDVASDDDDFCYQDADGRLFILGEDKRRIYLNEYGEPIED